MKKSVLILPLVLLALVACAPNIEPESENVAVAPEPTHLPQEAETVPPPTAVLLPPTAVPTEAPPTPPTAIPITQPTDEPAAEPTDVPTSEPAAETAVVAGRTDEGAFFFGVPDAPVTMIDYSDFL